MFATAQKANAKPKNASLFQRDQGMDAFIQPKLNIGKSGDQYEVEADRVADTVVARSNKNTSRTPFFAPSSTVQKKPEEELQTKQETGNSIHEKLVVPNITPIVQKQVEEERVQEKEDDEVQLKEEEQIQKRSVAGADPGDASSLESNLNSSKGGGNPLPSSTKNEMESGFGTDFSGVRVHNDSNAVKMSQQLGAQAFTHGSDVYFNEGKYNPKSDSGKHLLAHELTHTVQQGGATVKRQPLNIASSIPEMIQGFGVLDLIPDWIIEDARYIPGYTLFTVAIAYDPLRGISVERTPINLVQGLLELVPIIGPAIFDKLQEYGILEKAFDWVSGKLNELGLTTQGLLDLVEEAWDELEFPYTNAISVIAQKFSTLLSRISRFAGSLTSQLFTWVKEALIDVVEPYLEDNRAWSLIKKIIHYDPLRGVEVQAETVEILEDFLLLIGKETELEQMRERGTLQETADWLDTQIGTFMSLLGQLRNLIDSAWDAIQPENLPNILENIRAIASEADAFLEGVWTFASTVASEVLKLIKRSLLSWLNSFAADIPGFTLITVVIRKNPLTDEVVTRSVQNIIRGFMGLVPGGEAKYQELSESGVIPRAAGQIEALMEQLGISKASIVQLFTDVWNFFTIDDLLDPMAAFERVVAQFAEPISRLFRFVSKVVKILVNLILEIMGIPPDLVSSIMANAMSAFEDIKNDPIGFLLNLMNAVKNGFVGFLNNIGTHLISGLQNWLFGTLADAGVEIPSDLSVRSLLGMAMDVLGITIDNILERLAMKIGPERMAQIRSVLDRLTGIWTFVRDVIERGPIAIWEYIQGQISNLWNVIKEGIMGFIQERVIQQAIGWLMSFLDVTGIMPVIRGVQTVFNAITSFIEKLREILGIVNSFVMGIADIARGSIQSAAGFLETALADGIPVAISFLAKQLGLGDISEKIAEMIEDTRQMINEAIDWLIDKAMEAGTAFLSALGLGGSENEQEEETPTGPISDALTEIETEGEKEKDEGEVTAEEALAIKNKVNTDHASVINISSVTDGGDTWDYDYIQLSKKSIAKTSPISSTIPQLQIGETIRVFTGRKWTLAVFLRYELHTGNNFIHARANDGTIYGKREDSYNNGGWESYSLGVRSVSFDNLDQGRAKGVTATLGEPVMSNNSSRATPLGFVSGVHERGHLLGAQFGGDGRIENIAALYPRVNSPQMRAYETLVREAIRSGEIVVYQINVNYIGGELIPNSIIIIATGDKGLSINVTIPNNP